MIGDDGAALQVNPPAASQDWLLAENPTCWRCGLRPAAVVDTMRPDPPDHVDDSDGCTLITKEHTSAGRKAAVSIEATVTPTKNGALHHPR